MITLLTMGACAPDALTLNATTQAEGDPPQAYIPIGYGLGRVLVSSNPLVVKGAIYKLYYVNDGGDPIKWTAELINDSLPSGATTEAIGIGGLAAHPTDADKLYLSFDNGNQNGAKIYSYRISTDSWSLVSSFNPAGNVRYWGLGATCDQGKLAAVSRLYTTDETVDGVYVSFSPSSPLSTSNEFVAPDVAVADNAARYDYADLWVAGRTSDHTIYTTNDGSNLTQYATSGTYQVDEAWAIGLMSNPVLLPDDGECKRHHYMATANSSSQYTATPLYSIQVDTSYTPQAVKMSYENAFEQANPALVDLANLPDFCNADLLCATVALTSGGGTL